jgi:hypothetical protein
MLISYLCFPLAIIQERACGYYHLSAYFCAKTTSETPTLLVLPAVYMIIAYWMSGVNGNFLTFLASTSCTLLSALAGQSLGLLVGTIVFDIEKGIASCTVLSLTLMVAGGFYVRNIPPWLNWVKFISPFKYAYDASVQIVFNTPVPCGAGDFDGGTAFPSCSGNRNTGYLSHEDLLRFLGVQGSVFFNVTLLFILFIIFQVTAFVVLRSKQATERSF